MIKLGYLHSEIDIYILKLKDNHLKNNLENSLENTDFLKNKESMNKQIEIQSDAHFFDIGGIIMVELVPRGQIVDQYYYKEVLMKLRERVRKKRYDIWKNGWVLHQGNA